MNGRGVFSRSEFHPRMNFRSHLGHLHRRMLCAFYRRPVSLGDRGPIVSFAFDDFPRSALSAGGAILERYGAHGTYYVAAGLANSSGEVGDLFTEKDLYELREKGHEIASQTFHHSSCRRVSISAFQADVREGVKAIEHLTGGEPINFAYPYGHITLRSKKRLEPFLVSARSVIPGLNGPDIDLNLLRANTLYGGLDGSRCVEELIRQNVKQKSWLIFYTHDVRPRPSKYGCTPELFEFAVSHALRSNARILTVGEALRDAGTEHHLRPELQHEHV